MPTSRRSLLATTVAALAAPPLDAVATSAPGPDPVYALIEAHRKAFAVWNAAIDEVAKVEGSPDRQAAQPAYEAEVSTCHAEGDITHEIAITPATTSGWRPRRARIRHREHRARLLRR